MGVHRGGTETMSAPPVRPGAKTGLSTFRNIRLHNHIGRPNSAVRYRDDIQPIIFGGG